MARQNPGATSPPPPNQSPRPSPRRPVEPDDPDARLAAWAGERLRRVALGATAALLTARAFWTSEPDLRADAGGGLVWVLALLAVGGLGLAGALAGGNLRFRWSWADAGVVAMAALVGAASGQAQDRRVAINLAWEWGGVAVAYVLVRNLPGTRGESVALAGALAATAVAVSAYGLYQVGVELPEVQKKFLNNAQFRAMALRAVGVLPGTVAEEQFRNRLLHSNEPYSTFALANSLAGFVVGPLVVMLSALWDGLTRPGQDPDRGSRFGRLALALPPTVVVLVCLTMTKSRSAYLGLAVGLLVLAVRESRRVRGRTLAAAAVVAAAVVAGLVVAGLATGRLDREVLTEAPKSLRYRQEYWVGAWRAINESKRSFWRGFGSGNFSAPYLRHKLPQASEEIIDPHDFVLEVWATAGAWAVVALGVAVAFGVANTFLPSRAPASAPGVESTSLPSPNAPSAPPASPGWLVTCAGGGWLAVLLVGRMDLIGGTDFERWVILGGAWALTVALGVSLWRRVGVDPAALGAAAIAVLVNLTAAGGIGIPAVALALWTTVALGLNLRDDRPCGRPRGPLGRVPAFALAAVWVALLGTFIGAVTPYWQAEAAMADAEEALGARPPDFDRAEAAYARAKDADHFSPRPWLALAAVEYEAWKSRGAKHDDLRWRKVPIEMLEAVTRPRPEDSWTRHRERARMTGLLIKQLGDKLPPLQATRFKADVVHASRKAAQIYPTNATLRARLAEASADIGMIPDALKEGREALRLDDLMRAAHPDKKLEPSIRLWLESKLPDWEAAAKQVEGVYSPGMKGMPKP